MRAWYPQGITSSADATGDGKWGANRITLVSWYAKGSDAAKGVRISFVQTDQLRGARYRLRASARSSRCRRRRCRSLPAVKRDPAPPVLPDDLEATTIDRSAVEGGSEWARVALTEDELTELTAPGLRFEETRMTRVDLSSGRLSRLSISDAELEGCNLANAEVRGGTLWRVVVERCRLTGLAWTEGLVRDVVLRECRIDLASFAASRLEEVVFERCLLRQTELQEARLRKVRFLECDLSEVDLTQASFVECEMRGCTLDGVRAPERLRGVAMPWSDVLGLAGTLAAALGIQVLDD